MTSPLRRKSIFVLGFSAVVISLVGFSLASYYWLDKTIELINENRSDKTLSFLKGIDVTEANENLLRNVMAGYLNYDTLNNRQGQGQLGLGQPHLVALCRRWIWWRTDFHRFDFHPFENRNAV